MYLRMSNRNVRCIHIWYTWQLMQADPKHEGFRNVEVLLLMLSGLVHSSCMLILLLVTWHYDKSLAFHLHPRPLVCEVACSSDCGGSHWPLVGCPLHLWRLLPLLLPTMWTLWSQSTWISKQVPGSQMPGLFLHSSAVRLHDLVSGNAVYPLP